MRFFKQRQNNKGETLIETLVAIIVLTVSAMLLAEVSASSIKINNQAEAVDTRYRNELANVEKRESPVVGDIQIKSGSNTYTYEVEYYGDLVGLTSYTSKAGGI